MSVDVDQILRQHAEDATSATPPPGGWDRLAARLDEEPDALAAPPAGPNRTRARVLAAAAVVAVLAAVGALVLRGDDPDQGLDTTEQPSTTAPPATTEAPVPTTDVTAPTDTEPTPSSTPAVPPPTDPPRPAAVVVLVDRDGDGLGSLVALDPTGQRESRTLVEEWIDGDQVEGGSSGIVSVDVTADGIAYYEMGTEPAAGVIHAVDVATGEDLGFTAHGWAPAVSPGGDQLAVALSGETGVAVQLLDAATGEVVASLGDAPDDWQVSRLAWSPDGRRLARERVRYEADRIGAVAVDVIELDTSGAAAGEWRSVGDGLGLPAFLADGRLAVGRVPDGSLDGFLVRSDGLAIVDPATGDLSPRHDGLAVTSLDSSVDGTWQVAATPDGQVLTFGGEDLDDRDPVTAGEVVGSAAW